MKRFLLLACAFLFFVQITTLSGCGNNGGIKIDPNKKQVYVSVWNGGYGYEWLQLTVDEFNSDNQETQFIILPNKDYVHNISEALVAGSSFCDIFFTASSDIQSILPSGVLMDLTDVMSMKPDGENGETILSKMDNADLFNQVYSYDDKVYALAFTDSLQGFVYDHDLFVEEGFLFIDDGSTLTAGKDGIRGTWDDGLPVTESDWEYLLALIKSRAIYPFLWTGMYNYLNTLSETVWMQYDGAENYAISWDYTGDYVRPSDNEIVPITAETGYKAFDMEGKAAAVNFLEKYISRKVYNGAQDYVHPKSLLTGTSHRDAQDAFILGYKNTVDNPRSAMLYEGIWWENEARSMFDSLVKRHEPDQKYGNRDFRFMPLPNLDGQIGVGAQGNGSVFTVAESGSLFAKKQTDPVKEDAIKRFINYVHSDKILKRFTGMTGGLRPFKYELTTAEYNNLTKFGKNVWDIYTDRENVEIARPEISRYVSPLNYFTSPSVGRWTATKGVTYAQAHKAITVMTASEYLQKMKEYNSPTFWANMISQLT